MAPLPSPPQIIAPSNRLIPTAASRSLTQTRFIRWLAATARYSSRQLAADARELLTITPPAPPPAPPLVASPPRQAAPMSHEGTTSPPNHCSPNEKTTYHPFCLPVNTFSYTSIRCPFTTSTRTHILTSRDEKDLIGSSVR